MYSEEYQQPHIQNGYPQDFENEEYETEYESDNQFQPETVINPDLSMNGPPTLRSVTPGANNYGFGKSRPLYDPHFEFNYDTKTMTEEEKAKLKLHQGSVVQFPEKNPNPNYKNELAEYSHIDEATKYMIPKSTVQQYPEKNPNPNYKNELAEYSHVDEATKYMIQKPTVAQFQKKVPDFNKMKGLPQKLHMPDEEIYNKKQSHNLLTLHQGSVLQQPRHGDFEHVRKYMAYRPKPDSLKEEMPVARLPNRIPLPSQVKKMQTYITHPPGKTIRSIGFASSAPTSPTSRKNIWPPPEPNVRQLPRTGFNPNVMYKEDDTRKYVWPPTSSNTYGSLNDLNQPIPTIGHGPAANVWNPDPDGTNRSGSNYYTRFNPQQKIHAVWPPNRGGSMINLSSDLNNTNNLRLGESDTDYIKHSINTSVPLTYRCPPGTQYYKTPYLLSDENNNQLNEKMFLEQQRNSDLTQIKQQPEMNQSLDENYFDSEQHLDNEFQYHQQQQSQNQQKQQFNQHPQFNSQQSQQPLSRSANNSPSPIHFDQQNIPFNQQTDLYAKQQLQHQQLREFEKQQAEKIRQNRSHHLPKQTLNSNLINNEEFIQQPSRAKSPSQPVYRPVSPRNIYQQKPSSVPINPMQQEMPNQQVTVQHLPEGGQQIQYIQQQPTIVKQQVHQEQTYREQVEMQKQYYIQN